MKKRKILITIMIGSILVGSNIGEIGLKRTVLANELKVETNIEKDNIENLDDRELSVTFEDFEKNIDEYKRRFKIETKETVKVFDGVEIIDSNLKWNDTLDLSNNPKSIILHHIAASRPGQTIPVTDVHQWHLANGWAGIGYHFYITKDGKIYRGRPENAIGAHAKGSNIDSLGIAVEGEYQKENMPIAQRNAVEKLAGYLRGKYNVENIKGHGEVMATSCPGKNYPLNSIRNNILTYPIYKEPEAPVIDGSPAIQYVSHVQDEGWQNWKRDGEISGSVGLARRVEGIKIKLANIENSDIVYRVHVENDGWKSWVKNGELAGTKMESKRIEAIEIKLEGQAADLYDLEYKVHVQDQGWSNWTKNGDMAGTIGKKRRIESIQVRLVKKESVVAYQGHVEEDGWQDWKADGQMAGTNGKSRRLEAIKIIDSNLEAVDLEYRSHVQDEGWQGWKMNGEISGTIGEKKRLEAIEINLKGSNSNKYNVEYRTHVENIGWMPWVSNGQLSGTTGEAKRIEAIEVKITKK
ncbi:MAG: N-acetylmuramoyl-L-alanine amidase [Sarcina sp.]